MHSNGGPERIDDVDTCLEIIQVVSDLRWWVLRLDIELAYRVMDLLWWLLVTLEVVTYLLNYFEQTYHTPLFSNYFESWFQVQLVAYRFSALPIGDGVCLFYYGVVINLVLLKFLQECLIIVQLKLMFNVWLVAAGLILEHRIGWFCVGYLSQGLNNVGWLVPLRVIFDTNLESSSCANKNLDPCPSSTSKIG